MSDLYDRIVETVGHIRLQCPLVPRVAMVLGTGLGRVAERMEVVCRIPYQAIVHFPVSTVQGHKGMLLLGHLSGVPVVAMQGRFHYYEGYSLEEVTFPVRVMRALGADILILNSAVGGLNPEFKPADVMVVTDHISLFANNPLRGLKDGRLGDRFPDMSDPYDRELMDMVEKCARDLNIKLARGVYAWVEGPSLETRAETRMLRLLGADAVGMSTVPEVIVAVQSGFRTLVLAAVTNVNIPDSMETLSLEQVLDCAAIAEPKLTALAEEVLKQIR